jgi:hypothetical protein
MKYYRSNEAEEQKVVIRYCDIKGIPIVHIPNEGKRSARVGAEMKAMGLRPGFPDLFVPLPKKEFHGLFIEMKYGRNKLTDNQKEWLALLVKNGYACAVCYGADEAIKNIESYLKENV